MTRERIECPFCSELIMEDALKCRFCREWLSRSEPSAKASHSIVAIERAEPPRGAFEEVRKNYLATVEGIERRSASIEKTEDRAGSLPDRDDRDADLTVEAPERVERDRPHYRSTIENIWQRPESSESLEKTEHQNRSLLDSNGGTADEQHEGQRAVEASAAPLEAEISSMETPESGSIMKGTRIEKTRHEDGRIQDVDDGPAGEQHKGENAVEASAAQLEPEISSAETLESGSIMKQTRIENSQHGHDRTEDGQDGPAEEQHEDKNVVEALPVPWGLEFNPEETLESDSTSKGIRIPWLRVLMLLLYLGTVGALAVSESNAHRILREARAKESAQEQEAAFGMYRNVLDAFPLSFGAIEASRSLRRMCQAEAFKMPTPSWLTTLETLLGPKADTPDVHLLPFVAWPVSAVLLFLVLVTRIFRPRVAFLALVLMVVAIAGSLAQFASYGSISLPPVVGVVQGFMQATPAVYLASYLLLVLTALMTLTATAKRPSLHTEKVEQLWENIDRRTEEQHGDSFIEWAQNS